MLAIGVIVSSAAACVDDEPADVEAAITLPGDTSPIEPPPDGLAVISTASDRVEVEFTCGGHATSHKLFRQLSNGTHRVQVATIAACQPGFLSHAFDTTVQPITSYCYQVVASNSEHSAQSNLACATTPSDFAVPQQPTLDVHDVTATSAVLSIIDHANNESGFMVAMNGTNERFYPGQIIWRDDLADHSTGGVIEFPVTGLSTDTLYTFHVTVFHEAAPVQAAEVVVLFRTIPGPPTPPAGLTANPRADGAIELRWFDSLGEFKYQAVETHGAAPTQTLVADTTFTVFKNLAPGTRYCFMVNAHSSRGIAQSNEACATTVGAAQPPAAPQQPALFGAAPTSLSLQWQSSLGATAYRVHTSPGAVDDLSLSAGATSANITGLQPATRYCFVVFAQNALGSTASAQVCASTLDGNGNPIE